MEKVTSFGLNSLLGGFWGRLLRIWAQNFEIQYGGPRHKVT